MSKSEKEMITFRLERHLKDALDEVASSIQRDRSFVLSEAIMLYLDVHQWQLTDVQKAVQEANAGSFVSDEQVADTFAKWLPHEDSLG